MYLLDWKDERKTERKAVLKTLGINPVRGRTKQALRTTFSKNSSVGCFCRDSTALLNTNLYWQTERKTNKHKWKYKWWPIDLFLDDNSLGRFSLNKFCYTNGKFLIIYFTIFNMIFLYFALISLNWGQLKLHKNFVFIQVEILLPFKCILGCLGL